MMCLMRDENEREMKWKVIVMKDDVDERNNTWVVLLLGHVIDVMR